MQSNNLDHMMVQLAQYLSCPPFINEDDGSYRVDTDGNTILLSVNNGFIFFEANFDVSISRGNEYQTETAVIELGKAFLPVSKRGNEIIAMNNDSLDLQRKLPLDANYSSFYEVFSEFVNTFEYLNNRVKSFTTTHTTQNAVWLP